MPQSQTRPPQTIPAPEHNHFADRTDRSRSNIYQPFSTSVAAHLPHSNSSVEDQQRRGNDAILQHRHILGVSADDKRGGRVSPFPQAVQGAQAQSIGPESGIKSEFGRVFSGIGGGVGTATAGLVGGIVPPASTSSPFRREDFGSRPVEEPLTKVSRGGAAKRGRRNPTGEIKLDGEGGETHVPARPSKKSRHHQTNVASNGHQ